MCHCLVSTSFCTSACWQLHWVAGDWGLRDSHNIQEHPVWLMQHLLSEWRRHMHKHEPQWHRKYTGYLDALGLSLNSAHLSYFLALSMHSARTVFFKNRKDVTAGTILFVKLFDAFGSFLAYRVSVILQCFWCMWGEKMDILIAKKKKNLFLFLLHLRFIHWCQNQQYCLEETAQPALRTETETNQKTHTH